MMTKFEQKLRDIETRTSPGWTGMRVGPDDFEALAEVAVPTWIAAQAPEEQSRMFAALERAVGALGKDGATASRWVGILRAEVERLARK